jgi:hypothetical protein
VSGQAARLAGWEEAGVKGKVKKRSSGYFTYVKTLTDGQKVALVLQV